jgi:hypothetical protein
VPTAWSIGLVHGTSIHDLVVSEPVLSPGFGPVQHLSLVADPFFLSDEDRVYLYFEAVVGPSGKGEIHLAVLDRSGVEYVGPAVVEDVHMSYPYVFRDEANARCCMIPETSEAGDVRVYVSDDPAGPWTLERVLIEGRPFVDTVAFTRAGGWYLVTESSGGTSDRREVHRADALDGEFTLVVSHQLDPARCRLAGRVVDRTSPTPGDVHLLSQDCASEYGRSVSVETIGPWAETGGGPSEFHGEVTHLVGPDPSRWFHAKVHGLDLRVGPDGVVGVIDGKGRCVTRPRPRSDEIASFVAAATGFAGNELP